MALSSSTLSSDIQAKIREHFTVPEGAGAQATFLKNFSDAIAEAVVAHITSSAKLNLPIQSGTVTGSSCSIPVQTGVGSIS